MKYAAEIMSSETETSAKSAARAFISSIVNPSTGVIGWGGFISLPVSGEEKEFVLQGTAGGEIASMKKVAGEINGILAALEFADRHDMDEITLFCDYRSIESVKPARASDRKFLGLFEKAVEKYKTSMEITFVHMSEYASTPDSERADNIAKEAAGIIQKSDNRSEASYCVELINSDFELKTLFQDVPGKLLSIAVKYASSISSQDEMVCVKSSKFTDEAEMERAANALSQFKKEDIV